VKIQLSPYTLVLKNPLGRAQTGTRHGTLLRVEFPEGPGYADLHPWPEIGDVPIEEQLDLLKSGRHTALTRRTLEFAKRDAEARARKVSLLAGLSIPPSHYLVTESGTQEAINAYETGFRFFKLKLSPDLELAEKRFSSLCKALPAEARIRLDFNELLELEAFHQFLTRIDTTRIDFVEDPAPWTQNGWGKASVRLALDRNVGLANAEAWPEVVIVKPALNDPKTLTGSNRKLVVTSYLDHPLGQASAALIAAEFARDLPAAIETCGLLTHWAYETNDFSALLRNSGPRLLAPEGTGLGFDSVLARQNWREL
jgi:O-succinylbenzoate synthase